MIKRFLEWRQRQTPLTNLAVAYFLNTLALLIVNIFLDLVWPDGMENNFTRWLVKALRGAIVWTLLFDFDKVSGVFKKRPV